MKCERCGQDSRVTSMSIFNIDVICIPCKQIEEKHPMYEEARDAEMKAVLRGNMNYRGIGKPKDL